MGRRRPIDRLEDIRSAAADVLAFTEGLNAITFVDLPKVDRRTWRALKNALAEIGEAVKDLPPDLATRHPKIDWRGFAELRDIVTHAYFGLDMTRLWPTVTEEIPTLLATVTTERARHLTEKEESDP